MSGKITQLDEDYTLRNIRDRIRRHCRTLAHLFDGR
jgi:hypothetical protein